MIKIAIFGHEIKPGFLPFLKPIIDLLPPGRTHLTFYKPFYKLMVENKFTMKRNITFFENPEQLQSDTDIMLSIGGDGTFLDSVTFVQDKGIPIAGINIGRLGFLANISKDEIQLAIKNILEKKYTFEERDLIELIAPEDIFKNCHIALNEITVAKKDSSSMITIHAYLNGQFLNTYWVDGLIVATPTGSTAYSLSAGGPIVVPEAQNFIITPLAPHNLTVRPLVVPNNQELRLVIEGRDENCLISLDRRYQTIQAGAEIRIKKAKFAIKVVKLDERTFFSTLREKLMWGVDKRN
jgi:NAD+ kinase